MKTLRFSLYKVIILRNRILMAAAEEMKAHGVKFTMSDLAKHLRLSKSSLYEYFSSKSELVHYILITAIQDVSVQEKKIYDDESLSVLEKTKSLLKVTPQIFGPINNYNIYDDLCHYYPSEWEMVLNIREEQLERLTSFVIKNMQSNSLRKVNMPVLKQIVTSAMNDLFSHQFLEQANMTQADALAAMSDIIVYGLCPSKK